MFLSPVPRGLTSQAPVRGGESTSEAGAIPKAKLFLPGSCASCGKGMVGLAWVQEPKVEGREGNTWHQSRIPVTLGLHRDSAGEALVTVGGGCAGELLLGAAEPRDSPVNR